LHGIDSHAMPCHAAMATVCTVYTLLHTWHCGKIPYLLRLRARVQSTTTMYGSSVVSSSVSTIVLTGLQVFL